VLQLGAECSISVDLHVICATNRDLGDLVRQGLFRKDLYYRLNAATFELPPLRSRTDKKDVILCILREESPEPGRELTLAPDVLEVLTDYSWPGNLRELRNAMRYACALCGERILGREHLPADIVRGVGTKSNGSVSINRSACGALKDLKGTDQERKWLVAILTQNKWQVAASARQIGVSRATFYRWMSRHQIVQPNRIVSGE